MSGGTSGGGDQSSRPLTAEERSQLYDAAMAKMGGSIPKASDYQGYQIIDPSADRGRGAVYQGGGTGYAGYQNIAPRTIKDTTADYYGALQAQRAADNKTMQGGVEEFLNQYFAQRDAAAREAYNNFG